MTSLVSSSWVRQRMSRRIQVSCVINLRVLRDMIKRARVYLCEEFVTRVQTLCIYVAFMEYMLSLVRLFCFDCSLRTATGTVTTGLQRANWMLHSVTLSCLQYSCTGSLLDGSAHRCWLPISPSTVVWTKPDFFIEQLTFMMWVWRNLNQSYYQMSYGGWAPINNRFHGAGSDPTRACVWTSMFFLCLVGHPW